MKRKFASAIGIILFLLTFSLTGKAFDAPADGTTNRQDGQSNDAKARSLSYLKNAVKVLEETAKSGVITETQANQGTKNYLAQASQITGKEVSRDELMAIADTAEAPLSPKELSFLQRVAGAVTFINILWVLAIIVGIAAFLVFFGKVIVDLFDVIPKTFWEIQLYIFGVGLTVYMPGKWPEVAQYIALTGCLLLTGAIIFTGWLHKLRANNVRFFSIVFVIWAAAASFYHSSLLGFGAVIALMGAVGFSILVMPLMVAIGFEDEDALGKATATAFVILAGFTLMRIFNVQSPELRIFESGALFMGSFVGYLGLLIASTKWYDKRFPYALFQVVTIVAGITALLVGSVWGIGELSKIGGTFFVLYLSTKPFEIPAASIKGYSFITLVVCGLIYAFCMHVRLHPDIFSKYLFFVS